MPFKHIDDESYRQGKHGNGNSGTKKPCPDGIQSYSGHLPPRQDDPSLLHRMPVTNYKILAFSLTCLQSSEDSCILTALPEFFNQTGRNWLPRRYLFPELGMLYSL